MPPKRQKVESELSFQGRLMRQMRRKGWLVMHVPERWVQESSAIGYPDIEAIHM